MLFDRWMLIRRPKVCFNEGYGLECLRKSEFLKSSPEGTAENDLYSNLLLVDVGPCCFLFISHQFTWKWRHPPLCHPERSRGICGARLYQLTL